MRAFFSSSPYALLLCILVFAFLIRFFGISTIPSGLHNDEASFFLNAIAIKETGLDEDGRAYPLYLNSFIDPKPALYSYFQIPFIYLFGETITAARLPGVLLGVLSIGVIYFLFEFLLKRKAALIMTFLITINPWHIMLSRGTQEVIMSFFFSLLAVFLLLKLLKMVRISILVFISFSVSTILAMYSYHAAKLFLPILFLFMLYYFGKRGRQLAMISGSIFICCIIAFTLTSFQGGLIRANTISILSDPGTQLIIDEEIRTATGIAPSFLIRVFHNKVINYSMVLAHNYSDYFTGSFLFFKGGEPSRLSVPFSGLFYIVEALLFLLGIFIGFTRQQYKKISVFFLVWLLLSPLAGVLTIQEIPSITRTAFLLIGFIYFVGLSIEELFEKKHVLLGFLIILGYTGGICYFANQYIVQSQVYHPWSRNYADQMLVKKLEDIEDKYNKIYISTGKDSYVYFVLDDLIPLSELQQSYPQRIKDKYTLSKFIFSKNNVCGMPKTENALFVLGVACKIEPRTGFQQIDSVAYKDGAPEYQLLVYKKAADILPSPAPKQ